MRIGPLICALASGALGIAAVTPVSALAPGPSLVAAINNAKPAAADKAEPLVAVKWKWIQQPPGWSRGRKTGWRGSGVPPGHFKKGWF